MIRRVPRASIFVACLALLSVAVLAGCSVSPGSSASAPASPAGPAPSAVAARPTIEVVSPADGATIKGTELTVRVETTGLKFVNPSNSPVPGEGHLHLVLDERPLEMSVTPGFVFKALAPGPHTLRSELVQNDTTPFAPPVFKTTKFTVK